MTSRAVRHLPVIERDRLVGIVSIGDLVKRLLEEQKFVLVDRRYQGQLGTIADQLQAAWLGSVC